jgi:hypothetical protein
VDAVVVVVELEAVLAQALRSSSSLTHVSPAFIFNAAKMMCFLQETQPSERASTMKRELL